MIISASQRVKLILCLNINDSRVVENVYVPSEITSVNENTLVDFSTLILDDHVSSEVLVMLWMR